MRGIGQQKQKTTMFYGYRFELPLVIVLAIALTLYHLLLDQYYCLSADDFAGIDYASKGFPGLGYAWRFYFGWEGPFLSLVIQGLLMWAVSVGVPPVVVLFTIKFSLLLSTFSLITSITKFFDLNWSRSQQALIVLVFQIALYLISPNKSEIWHWLIGTVYLTPLIFLQLGIALLLQGRFLLALMPLAVVMQSRATYSVLIFGFIAVTCLVSIVLKWKNRKQWIILCVGMFVSLLIYLSAPGNYVRMTEHGKSISFMISQFRTGLQNLVVSYNLAKLDRVMLALMVVLPVLGGLSGFPRPKKALVWSVPALLYLVFIVAHELMFVLITGYCEWTRVLSLHAFLFVSMASVYGMWFYSMIPSRIRSKLVPISILGVFGLLMRLYFGYPTELRAAKLLNHAYENRMGVILEHQGKGDTLYVEPVNYEGVLYFEDFSKNPDNWINEDFRKAYGLDFKIALKNRTNEQ